MSYPHPLDLEIQQRFLALEQGEKTQAEYIWVGGNNVRAPLCLYPCGKR